eukprot:5674470-Prymnesium_polylepis.1
MQKSPSPNLSLVVCSTMRWACAYTANSAHPRPSPPGLLGGACRYMVPPPMQPISARKLSGVECDDEMNTVLSSTVSTCPWTCTVVSS